MKPRISLFFLFIIFGSQGLLAQLKIGYIDSQSVIDQLPDAQDAQKKIDAQIDEWQKELDGLKKNWQDKYDEYQRTKLIMGNQKKAETEKELVSLEQKVENYRQTKFGANGELYKKQEELMKPIQNEVFAAIDKVAKDKDLDFVFDRSGDLIFLYAKEEYDITRDVLAELQ